MAFLEERFWRVFVAASTLATRAVTVVEVILGKRSLAVSGALDCGATPRTAREYWRVDKELGVLHDAHLSPHNA